MIYRDIRARVKMCRMSRDGQGFAIGEALEVLPPETEFLILSSIWREAPHFNGPPVRNAQLLATVVDNKMQPGKWLANSVYAQLTRWYPGYLAGWSASGKVNFVRLRAPFRPCDEAMCEHTTMEDYLPGVSPQRNKGLPVDVAVSPNANQPGNYVVMALRVRADSEVVL